MPTYIIIGPDQLPLRPEPFRSRKAAEIFIPQWCARYTAQGYYSSVDGRIALEELPRHCTIMERSTGKRPRIRFL